MVSVITGLKFSCGIHSMVGCVIRQVNASHESPTCCYVRYSTFSGFPLAASCSKIEASLMGEVLYAFPVANPACIVRYFVFDCAFRPTDSRRLHRNPQRRCLYRAVLR